MELPWINKASIYLFVLAAKKSFFREFAVSVVQYITTM